MIRRISVAAFILLTSCAMSRPQFVSRQPAMSRPQFIARQPVDEQVRVITSFKTEIPETKTVGETMIERVYMQVYPGFEAAEDFTIPNVSVFNTSPPPVLKGARWRCMQHISADDYACSTITSNPSIAPGKRNYDLVINKSGEVIGIVEETFGNLIKFNNVIGGKLLPIDVPNGESFKQELNYSGLSENTIKLSCREYKNEMARPVFIQDLTYDIARSREIAFQDLRIEILYVTESTINFFVKK
jgi:hypothetical protein